MAPSTTIVADAACRVLVARNLRGSLSYVQSEARRTEIQDRGLNAHDRTSLLPLPMKYSTIPRMSNVSIQDIIATSGRLYLAAIELPKGFRVQNISFLSASRAAVAPTNQWFGLFDAGRTAVAVTENDTINPWPANSLKTLVLQSPHVTTYTGVYYLGLLVTADTTPNFVAALGNAIYSGIEPVIAASQSTALTAPPPLPYVAPTLVPASQIAFAGVG